MCRNVNKSIYQLGWFIKLWKQRGFVNTKRIVNVQINFQTQLPLYTLDTSIICSSVMVSASDVSRQQIGDMANLAARVSWVMRGNQWIMKGPFIKMLVVSCGNGGQGRIKTSSCFQKWVCSKLKNSGKYKIYKFLKYYACIDPKHPQTIGSHRSGKDMEIQGPVRRETDLSPFRVVPAIDLNQLCTGIFLLLRSHGKIQISNLLRLFGPKKEARILLCSVCLRNFLGKGVNHKSSKMTQMIAQHLATMSHWSPFVGLGYLRGSWHSSGLENLLRHYLWLRMWSKNLISRYMCLWLPIRPPEKWH